MLAPFTSVWYKREQALLPYSLRAAFGSKPEPPRTPHSQGSSGQSSSQHQDPRTIWVSSSCQSHPCACPTWCHYGVPGCSSWLILAFSVGMFYGSVSASLKVFCPLKTFSVQRSPRGKARPKTLSCTATCRCHAHPGHGSELKQAQSLPECLLLHNMGPQHLGDHKHNLLYFKTV